MGLLSLGTPLPWSEVRKHTDHVREHGIQQFLHIWRNHKDRCGDALLWGDEVEYMVVSYDDQGKRALLSLRQAEILKALEEHETAQRAVEDAQKVKPCQRMPTFHPEYGRYMLEATPGVPYTGALEDLLYVESNMRRRRAIAKEHMAPSEYPVTLASYPVLGVPGQFTEPFYPPTGAASRSLFLPDELINPHARFPTLTGNIRSRRQSKVAINVPIFVDERTPRPFHDPTIPRDRALYPEDANARDGAALDDHIYMDSMGFGMGCCCLQITFQAAGIDEARRLYDQLTPLSPIFLALTAASPAFRGYLADVDCRWDVIAGSVDDRTAEERGLKPLEHDRFVIRKSRYDSTDLYLSQAPEMRDEYNDTEVVKDPAIRQTLVDAGVDGRLADHYAHLFIRDPIVVFSELIDQDDATSSDHFENIQSTNWQTMRFKPPPPGTDIGWRVEFRPMEIQMTDFENAAFAVFIVLLTRAIVSFGLNFYIPISRVEANMAAAQRRDAVGTQQFYFRKDVFSHAAWAAAAPPPAAAAPSPDAASSAPSTPRSASSVASDESLSSLEPAVEDEYALFSIGELINGKHDAGIDFPGLAGLVEAYLDRMNVDIATRCQLGKYIQLIRRRASGELDTAAAWIRKFVRAHPAYKFDSVVSNEINYDLVKMVENITEDREWDGAAASMLGGVKDL
ncbi:glutamate-cysteine ligase-domain-containing protein [Dipodascopsis tothii]|uniref:glutamate-cysteine ligase-domain-containing protein n=1 Tax=Dipodascopsis tothii TaxID=44089 RepID=UPI0034CD1293